MESKLVQRSWLSPATGICFVMVAVTGVLMFFHVQSFSIHVIHEWLGLAFCVVGALHIVLNWKPLLSYLRKPAALVGMGAVVLVSLALLGMAAVHGEQGERHGPGQGRGPMHGCLEHGR